MNLQKLSQVSEIVSAIAVVVSLIYVGFELRENTSTLRTNAKIESQRVFYTFNDINLQNPELLELGAKAYDPNYTLQDFEGTDRVWIGLFMRTLNQRYEELYFRYEAGYLDEDAWERNRTSYASMIRNLPIWKQYWSEDEPLMSPTFRENIEAAGSSAWINTIGSQLQISDDAEVVR